MKRLINNTVKFQCLHFLRLMFCSLSIIININAQSQIEGFCATSPNASNRLGTTRMLLRSSPSSYTLRIFLHIMRKSDGTGGQTQQEVNTAFNTLVSDYQPYNISFVLLGTDEIKSDDYYYKTNFYANNNGDTDLNGDGKFDVFAPNSHV